jgi:glutathione S-transferase
LKFPNGDVAFDSLKIAEYLDEKYPGNPLNPHSKELDGLVEHYDKTCNYNACKMNIKELLSYMDDKSREYFIDTRVPMIKALPDNFEFNQEEDIAEYFENLKPVIKRLKKSKFIDGDKPLIHDYIVISKIQMVKTISPDVYYKLIENNPSEIFKKWVERMEGLFGNFLKNRKTILTN